MKVQGKLVQKRPRTNPPYLEALDSRVSEIIELVCTQCRIIYGGIFVIQNI
jgi:hypothetical protein